MKTKIENLENKVIRRYGFENKKTILTFKLTEFLRKIFRLPYEA